MHPVSAPSRDLRHCSVVFLRSRKQPLSGSSESLTAFPVLPKHLTPQDTLLRITPVVIFILQIPSVICVPWDLISLPEKRILNSAGEPDGLHTMRTFFVL